MVGKWSSEWRLDSRAAIADWATSDEYTQIPLLRSSAGRTVAPPDRAAAAGRARSGTTGRPGSFRVERSRSRHDGSAPGGPSPAAAGRAAGPRVRIWPDRHGPGPTRAGRARLAGGRQRM